MGGEKQRCHVRRDEQFEHGIANLASYLRKRGVEVQEGVSRQAFVTNAERLVALLEQAEAVPRRSGFLRHELVQRGVNLGLLTSLFPSMVEAHVPQPLDCGENSRYADKWRISCYLQVKKDWKPRVAAHEPVWLCIGGFCDERGAPLSK